MKILHTSDWHLGRHLGDKDRIKEHDRFLSWLIGQLRDKEIDLLLVAGDIFDTGYPPNSALKQYYDFLRQIPDTPCHHVIIVGGNHDAVSTLNAPRELLKYFHIHVIGGAEEDIAKEIVIAKDKAGTPMGIVCAVPFLRTRDIKKANAGETYDQWEKGIAEGIARHYRRVWEAAVALRKELGNHLPVIATGHLFASGFERTESMRDIYVGDLGQVSAESFSPEFDYVALGHFHHAQKISKKEHIRYSGAPIPLSFSEAGTGKSVFVAEFHTARLVDVRPVEIPCFRRLRTFKGPLEHIAEELNACEKNAGHEMLTPWGYVQVETERYDPTIHDKIMSLAQGKPIEILRIDLKNRNYDQNPGMNGDHTDDLEELDPTEVFLKKCELEGIEGEEKAELLRAFQELLSEMQDEDEDKDEDEG
ncbi:exonuclease SbcCD subunit D C-terminal domain-containing protein [Desulfobacterales bacterium HSG2]|nr:exonuclease SbcCD subunit D C-terminal domain-containing protein [Desulfobacterales bacterium HSG2]